SRSATAPTPPDKQGASWITGRIVAGGSDIYPRLGKNTGADPVMPTPPGSRVALTSERLLAVFFGSAPWATAQILRGPLGRRVSWQVPLHPVHHVPALDVQRPGAVLTGVGGAHADRGGVSPERDPALRLGDRLRHPPGGPALVACSLKFPVPP